MGRRAYAWEMSGGGYDLQDLQGLILVFLFFACLHLVCESFEYVMRRYAFPHAPPWLPLVHTLVIKDGRSTMAKPRLYGDGT